jgi:hypothetical protein
LLRQNWNSADLSQILNWNWKLMPGQNRNWNWECPDLAQPSWSWAPDPALEKIYLEAPDMSNLDHLDHSDYLYKEPQRQYPHQT